MKCSSYYIITWGRNACEANVTVTVSDSIHSSFPVEDIFYIFFRENFQKTVKKKQISSFCGIYKRVSPRAVKHETSRKKKFAFLKAAEHCYDAFLPRYK